MDLQNTVKEALNALYHHPDDAVRMQADRYLQDFQRTLDAWQVLPSIRSLLHSIRFVSDFSLSLSSRSPIWFSLNDYIIMLFVDAIFFLRCLIWRLPLVLELCTSLRELSSCVFFVNVSISVSSGFQGDLGLFVFSFELCELCNSVQKQNFKRACVLYMCLLLCFLQVADNLLHDPSSNLETLIFCSQTLRSKVTLLFFYFMLMCS